MINRRATLKARGDAPHELCAAKRPKQQAGDAKCEGEGGVGWGGDMGEQIMGGGKAAATTICGRARPRTRKLPLGKRHGWLSRDAAPQLHLVLGKQVEPRLYRAPCFAAPPKRLNCDSCNLPNLVRLHARSVLPILVNDCRKLLQGYHRFE